MLLRTSIFLLFPLLILAAQPFQQILWFVSSEVDNIKSQDSFLRRQAIKYYADIANCQIREVNYTNIKFFLERIPYSQSIYRLYEKASQLDKQKEFLKILLLEHYGGFWIEQKVLPIQNLTWIFNTRLIPKQHFLLRNIHQQPQIMLFGKKKREQIFIDDSIIIALPHKTLITRIKEKFIKQLQQLLDQSSFSTVAQQFGFVYLFNQQIKILSKKEDIFDGAWVIDSQKTYSLPPNDIKSGIISKETQAIFNKQRRKFNYYISFPQNQYIFQNSTSWKLCLSEKKQNCEINPESLIFKKLLDIKRKKDQLKYWDVPKILWVYWKQGFSSVNSYIKLCLRNQQFFANLSGWELRILTKQNIKEVLKGSPFINDINNLQTYKHIGNSNPVMSDLYRIALLQQYGGLWIDISTILVRDLAWLQRINRQADVVWKTDDFPDIFTQRFRNFSGKKQDGTTFTTTTLQQYFMAGRPHSRWLIDYLKDKIKILPLRGPQRLQFLKKNNILNYPDTEKMAEYLGSYLVAGYTIQMKQRQIDQLKGRTIQTPNVSQAVYHYKIWLQHSWLTTHLPYKMGDTTEGMQSWIQQRSLRQMHLAYKSNFTRYAIKLSSERYIGVSSYLDNKAKLICSAKMAKKYCKRSDDTISQRYWYDLLKYVPDQSGMKWYQFNKNYYPQKQAQEMKGEVKLFKKVPKQKVKTYGQINKQKQIPKQSKINQKLTIEIQNKIDKRLNQNLENVVFQKKEQLKLQDYFFSKYSFLIFGIFIGFLFEYILRKIRKCNKGSSSDLSIDHSSQEFQKINQQE